MERRSRAGRGCDVGRGAARQQGAVDRGAAQQRGARRGEAEIGRGRAGYAPPYSAGVESASRLQRLRLHWEDVQCVLPYIEFPSTWALELSRRLELLLLTCCNV